MKKTMYNIQDEFNLDTLDIYETSYITDRVLAQIKWYDNKAKKMQYKYKKFSILSFCLSSAIPILALINSPFLSKIIVAILGAIISIINYILNICTYKELWVKYRTNCEILKSKLHLYLNKQVRNQENFIDFVCECEKCFTNEFDSWNDIQSKSCSSTGS